MPITSDTLPDASFAPRRIAAMAQDALTTAEIARFTDRASLCNEVRSARDSPLEGDVRCEPDFHDPSPGLLSQML